MQSLVLLVLCSVDSVWSSMLGLLNLYDPDNLCFRRFGTVSSASFQNRSVPRSGR